MNVFWDLDGTLVDPFLGITDAVRYALERSGFEAPPADKLGWVIGPALIDTFTKLGVPDPQAALGHYRDHYTGGGMYRATVYDGMLKVLSSLDHAGHTMYLMTAKPHAYAGKITAHFGLSKYMAEEFGPELDGTRNDKAELLAFALDKLGATDQPGVMIGDREYDFIAGQKNGLATIGAQWGYGTKQELAMADQICEEPTLLPGLVSGLSV